MCLCAVQGGWLSTFYSVFASVQVGTGAITKAVVPPAPPLKKVHHSLLAGASCLCLCVFVCGAGGGGGAEHVLFCFRIGAGRNRSYNQSCCAPSASPQEGTSITSGWSFVPLLMCVGVCVCSLLHSLSVSSTSVCSPAGGVTVFRCVPIGIPITDATLSSVCF